MVLVRAEVRRIRTSGHNCGVVCQHTEDPVTFPDGTSVLASGWLERRRDTAAPDFGLYLDPAWEPWWPAVLLDWPDFGVPADAVVADREIRAAFERARQGQRVEIACVGGHGRTGSVLACMAVLAGVPGAEAVEWVRSRYCRRAVQEPSQGYWVERWAERSAARTGDGRTARDGYDDSL
jgi:hypothetical protein